MVSSLLKMGFKSLDHMAARAERRVLASPRQHPLSAYPRLHSLLTEAERSGVLAAERRRLLERRWTA